MTKKEILKIFSSIIIALIGIALIIVGSYFINYFPNIKDLIGDLRFWKVFASIISLIIGIGFFCIGILIIAQHYYIKSIRKQMDKNKEIYG